MWVRPLYQREVAPDLDDRRLVHVGRYQAIEVRPYGAEGPAYWAVIAAALEREDDALLAAVFEEKMAVAAFQRVQQGLAEGASLVDLTSMLPPRDTLQPPRE